MKKKLLVHWRASFFAGLAIVLPAVISVVVIFWLFFTASHITDTLLILVPRDITHETAGGEIGAGPMHWYWSLIALVLAVFLISLVGMFAGNYLGKKMIEWVDIGLLRVPVLNKIYGTTKQVNEAFTSSNKNSFKTVVMIEFPRTGAHSIGFLTGDAHGEIQSHLPEKSVCVFVPTTPNPTAGFMMIVPEAEVIKLDMSVAEGLKFIISLGSLSPDHATPPLHRGDEPGHVSHTLHG